MQECKYEYAQMAWDCMTAAISTIFTYPGVYSPRRAFKAPRSESRGEATLFIEAWTETRAVFTRLGSGQYQGPFHVIMSAHLELMLSGIVKGP